MDSIYNNTVLVPNMDSLYRLLNKEPQIIKSCIYADRIVIKHYKKHDMNIVRIWNTKSIMDNWFDKNCSSKNFIAAVDYTIYDDKLKIDFMDINDKNSISKRNNLSDSESIVMNKNLIKFCIEKAKENKKNKIVVDVHNNLRIYNDYYKPEGFNITDRKCEDNPRWLEAEYNICNS